MPAVVDAIGAVRCRAPGPRCEVARLALMRDVVEEGVASADGPASADKGRRGLPSTKCRPQCRKAVRAEVTIWAKPFGPGMNLP